LVRLLELCLKHREFIAHPDHCEQPWGSC